MKNIIFSLALFMMSLSAVFTYAQADPCNEGRARGEAHANAAFQSCYSDFQSTGLWDVDVTVTSTPGKDGCTYVVEAWACPACHGPNPCPRIACRRVAMVYLDSNFNVWYVETMCM